LLARPERDSPMRTIVLHLSGIESKHIAPRPREDRPPYACVKFPGATFCIHLSQPSLHLSDGTATLVCSAKLAHVPFSHDSDIRFVVRAGAALRRRSGPPNIATSIRKKR
jgi:hypothetical protein